MLKSNSTISDEDVPITLSERAYRQLRRDIVSGAFQPGQPLRLENLRQRYGLSFSPLREALNRLQTERLVVMAALRGFTVAEVSSAEMHDAMETRILIECEALSRSMANGDDFWEGAIIAALHALSRQVERTAQKDAKLQADEISILEERHREFHVALIARCGSPRLLALAEQFYAETQRYRLPSLVGQAGLERQRDVHAEHQEIADAVLARRPKALDLLAQHYRRTATFIETVLNATQTEVKSKAKRPSVRRRNLRKQSE